VAISNTMLFIVFSLCDDVLASCIQPPHLREKCYLPHGLSDRLLCALLRWSQHCPDINPAKFKMNKNAVTMHITNVPFTLILRPSSNCIEVNAAVGTPVTLMRRHEIIFNGLIEESIQSLHLQSFVVSRASTATLGVGVGDLYLIPAAACMKSQPSYIFKSLVDDSDISFDGATVGRQYPWLRSTKVTNKFDVFLSHRWGAPDDEIVEGLFDHLSD
jgi:hypothetical protein